MKKEIFITKQNMIDAVKTEPLAPGVWISMVGTIDCEVCAVGGVLRAAGVQEDSINQVANNCTSYSHVEWNSECEDSGWRDIDDLLEDYIDDGKYLAALSIKFEDLANDSSIATARVELVEWIEDNIPSDMKISIII